MSSPTARQSRNHKQQKYKGTDSELYKNSDRNKATESGVDMQEHGARQAM
jgi:hypothetical protein